MSHFDGEARARIVEKEIERFLGDMGAYHHEHFGDYCRKVMLSAAMQAKAHSESEIAAAITLLASQYQADAARERKRILDIDALAEGLPASHKAMVFAAKYETPCTAGEFAERIIAADRRVLYGAPAGRH